MSFKQGLRVFSFASISLAAGLFLACSKSSAPDEVEEAPKTDIPLSSGSQTPETTAPSTDPVVTAPVEPTTPVNTTPSEPTTEIPPEVETPQTPIAVVGWDEVNTKVFQASCVRCHGAGGELDLSTYETTIKWLDAIEEQALVKKTMPPRRALSDEVAAVLKAWIEAGAPK